MKKIVFLLVFSVLLGCGGKDDGPPPSPEGATLVFPEKNSECTTGVAISETQTQVTFQWQQSQNTDRYILTVINLTTNIPQAISTTNTSATLSIDKGSPFSWSIVSSNSQSDETATSESWLFYNQGAQTSYAPFPAQIIFPVPGSTVQANEDNQVIVSWLGADVEDDIVSYEVYFSEVKPPETLLVNVTSETLEAPANVVPNTTYYWKVITKDAAGNISDSGVFDFKIL